MSLIEILVVVAVFAVLGVLVTRSIVVTLRGARKSENQIRVKEELNYATAVMERHLRSATEIECPNASPNSIGYTSYEGQTGLSFSCVFGPLETQYYVASSSARVTTNKIKVTSCNFSCEQANQGDPPKVSISITAEDSTAVGSAEKATVTVDTEIIGRNYQNY